LAQQRKKANEIGAGLGVSGWSLNRWRKEMESSSISTAQPESLSGGLDNSLNALELAKENGRLRREVEALTRQREILKRQSRFSIFAAQNPKGNITQKVST
jgi:transposase-like protein